MHVSHTHRTLAALALLFAAGAATAQPAQPAQPGPVVFSELMWAGSDASSADEWIELYNRSATAVELDGWTITRGDGDDEEPMVVIAAATLPAGGVFLIANYDADDERSRLAAVPQLVDAAVSLPNTKLRLRLYDGLPESARLIDEADDGSGAPFGGMGGDGPASMVRADFDMAGDRPEAWTTAAEAKGWDPGAAERGTPGLVGTPPVGTTGSSTHVAASSWGRLKAAR